MVEKIGRDRRKEAMWRERLRRRAASGLTVAEWCRRNKVSDSLFHYWKGVIARRDGGCKRAGRQRAASSKEEPAFARVMVAPTDATADCGASEVGVGVEIVLAGGRRLRVGAGFDAATLARVVAVLEGGSC
jgi:hypothetical protein